MANIFTSASTQFVLEHQQRRPSHVEFRDNPHPPRHVNHYNVHYLDPPHLHHFTSIDLISLHQQFCFQGKKKPTRQKISDMNHSIITSCWPPINKIQYKNSINKLIHCELDKEFHCYQNPLKNREICNDLFIFPL
jgi:hypothetical protein